MLLRKKPGLFLFLITWIAFTGAGFWRLFIYSNTPGASAHAKNRWPHQSSLVRKADRGTLVVFAHPQCPCSQASVAELERIIPHILDRLQTHVVFVKPRGKPEAWVTGTLWQKSSLIPNVTTQLDRDGIEAEYFGAETSGQTFLYDAQGNLVFSGGITPGRGHMGGSRGKAAILEFSKKGHTSIASAPVFGCSLKNPERAIAEKLE